MIEDQEWRERRRLNRLKNNLSYTMTIKKHIKVVEKIIEKEKQLKAGVKHDKRNGS